MLAIVAAVLFGLALILALAGAVIPVLTPDVLMLAGLLFLSLHQGGIGSGTLQRDRRRR